MENQNAKNKTSKEKKERSKPSRDQFWKILVNFGKFVVCLVFFRLKLLVIISMIKMFVHNIIFNI